MKQLCFILIIFGLSACSLNYPTTTFYVKNTTNKTLNFKATLSKQSIPKYIPHPNDIFCTQTIKDAEPKNVTKLLFPTHII